MLNGELLKKCNLQRGELFLLAGGPPCQGFSVQRRGSDTDERNELVLKYGKLIDELYPMYFVMENVTGIAGKRGKTILQQLIEDVEQIGYKVHVDLLDAQDYGVPQRRKRYIIVGERNDLGEHYKYPEPVAARHTVRDTIGNLPAPPSRRNRSSGNITPQKRPAIRTESQENAGYQRGTRKRRSSRRITS